MYAYEPILRDLEARVRASFARQVTDRDRPEYGAFIDPRMPHPTCYRVHHQDLGCAVCAWMADGSTMKGDEELRRRVLAGIEFLRASQRPSGRVDWPIAWDAPTDTGFVVEHLALVATAARRLADSGNAEAASIAGHRGLKDFIVSAANGVIGAGFKTPNHRWVICSALACASSLFPEIEARPYIDDILAETIDANEDGEFRERSTGIYNAICDRSLRSMAEFLDDPKLLDPVRKNLDMMLWLFNPDWTVESRMSSRRDRESLSVPFSLADSYFDMATRDGNGVWATVADNLVSRGGDRLQFSWTLLPFLLNPKSAGKPVERKPVPTSYRKRFPAAGVWRVRRGAMTASAIANNNQPFRMLHGEIHLKALRVLGTYCRPIQFTPGSFEALADGVRLSSLSQERGYELPLGAPIPFEEYAEFARRRKRMVQPAMDTILTVTESGSGFNINLKTRGGLDNVTFRMEFCLAGPGRWETREQFTDVRNGDTTVLKSGYGVYRAGASAVRIGPGAMEHQVTSWDMEGDDADPEAFRILLLLTTPIDKTIELRYGAWSLAESGFVATARRRGAE